MENRKWDSAIDCSDAGHPGGVVSEASKGVAREGFRICGKQRGYGRNLGSVAKKGVSARSGKWKIEIRKWGSSEETQRHGGRRRAQRRRQDHVRAGVRAGIGRSKIESRKWRTEKSARREIHRLAALAQDGYPRRTVKLGSRKRGGLAAKSHKKDYHAIIVRSSKNKSFRYKDLGRGFPGRASSEGQREKVKIPTRKPGVMGCPLPQNLQPGPHAQKGFWDFPVLKTILGAQTHPVRATVAAEGGQSNWQWCPFGR